MIQLFEDFIFLTSVLSKKKRTAIALTLTMAPRLREENEHRMNHLKNNDLFFWVVKNADGIFRRNVIQLFGGLIYVIILLSVDFISIY